MRAVSRAGGKRRGSGDGAGLIPAKGGLKEEVEASTFFSSGCNRENWPWADMICRQASINHTWSIIFTCG